MIKRLVCGPVSSNGKWFFMEISGRSSMHAASTQKVSLAANVSILCTIVARGSEPSRKHSFFGFLIEDSTRNPRINSERVLVGFCHCPKA